jgi:hypothetical protein
MYVKMLAELKAELWQSKGIIAPLCFIFCRAVDAPTDFPRAL